MGKHGEFTVEVSAKDGAIDRITVLDSRETPGMGDVAMEKMTQAIIDNQTLAVDTISGATLTSMAFLTVFSPAAFLRAFISTSSAASLGMTSTPSTSPKIKSPS